MKTMEKIKEQPILTEEETTIVNAENKAGDIGTLLRDSLTNAGKFETNNEKEFLAKDIAVDRLLDAQAAVHEEKKSNNPADLYAAYAALQEAQKYCSKTKDFGIEKTMIALRHKMKEKYGLTPENMKTANREIASRQKKILNESENFYENSAEETENNLTEFFEKTEEKTSANKEGAGNPLLKYLEKSGKPSKILCAVAFSLAMSGIFFGKESKAETENKIPSTIAESMENDTPITAEKTDKELKETTNVAAPKTMETMELAKKKLTELQESIGKIMKEMGIFAKLGLIKELKKYSAEILEVLEKDDYEGATTKKLLNNENKNLKTVIDIYLNGLKEIKGLNKDVYKEAAGKLKTLVNDTLNLSLGELKAKYLG